jgi:hypothetical protein
MMTELRAVFFLAASFMFFLIIIGALSLGMMMKPDRWAKRLKSTT